MRGTFSPLVVFAALLWAPLGQAAPRSLGPRPQAPNTLSKAEQDAGWRLLFDGVSTSHWRGFKSAEFPAEGWIVSDGTLHRAAKGEDGKAHGGGDIVTLDEYDDFELRLDWRQLAGGNSGVKYLVDESLVKSGRSGVGFEMQILDDVGHPDAKLGIAGNRTCGALYDLIAPRKAAARPVGEWNEARVVVDGLHVEHWLNGEKVVEFQRGSDALKALVARSKFKDVVGFGEGKKGHVLIQDHGDEAWFRNLKIRPGAPRKQK